MMILWHGGRGHLRTGVWSITMVQLSQQVCSNASFNQLLRPFNGNW